MAVDKTEEQARWYVLIAYKKELCAEKELEEENMRRSQNGEPPLRFYVPMYYKLDGTDKKHRVRRPLIPNYVFIRATLSEIYEYKKERSYLKFYMTHLPGENPHYTIVMDSDMESFIKVSQAYGQNVRYYHPSEIDLLAGDTVRIIGGVFDGVVGKLLSQQGKEGGTVLVQIPGVISVQTWQISPEYIEILSFAEGTTRLYDNLDAFYEKARQALLNKVSGKKITDSEVASLTFCISRLQNLNVSTVNIQSRLVILLLVSHALLGNEREKEDLLTKANEILCKLKSPMQRAYHLIYMYACSPDDKYLSEAESLLNDWHTFSKDKKKLEAYSSDLNKFRNYYSSPKDSFVQGFSEQKVLHDSDLNNTSELRQHLYSRILSSYCDMAVLCHSEQEESAIRDHESRLDAIFEYNRLRLQSSQTDAERIRILSLMAQTAFYISVSPENENPVQFEELLDKFFAATDFSSITDESAVQMLMQLVSDSQSRQYEPDDSLPEVLWFRTQAMKWMSELTSESLWHNLTDIQAFHRLKLMYGALPYLDEADYESRLDEVLSVYLEHIKSVDSVPSADQLLSLYDAELSRCPDGNSSLSQTIYKEAESRLSTIKPNTDEWWMFRTIQLRQQFNNSARGI